jgi:hypothetical protein
VGPGVPSGDLRSVVNDQSPFGERSNVFIERAEDDRPPQNRKRSASCNVRGSLTDVVWPNVADGLVG